MTKLAVDSFLELVRRSGLVEKDQLERALSVLESEHPGETVADSRVMARRLVDAGLLTDWQTQNLLEGRYKRFFLGKHKLLRLLGSGGMSSVYLAEHVMLRRREAIKVLPQSRVKDSSYLERFLREAEAAARLEHPNIIHTYDISCEDDTYYIVMEYVEGRDLYQFVRDQGPLPFEVAAKYVCQAATGLAHAHEKGLVHRDVKPANLLVDARGTVKLLDLGLALAQSDDSASLTVAHDEEVLGTADYLPPEQAVNSHNVDSRADIYSLGCTLYYLLTGFPPFPEGTLAQRLIKHQMEQPTPIAELRPDTPIELIQICQKMMAKKREDRFQTALDVRQALYNWLATRSSGGSGILTRLPRGGAGGSSVICHGAASSPGGKNAALSDTASGKDGPTVKGPSRAARPGGSPAAKPIGKPAAQPAARPANQSPFGFPEDLLGELDTGVTLDAPALGPPRSRRKNQIFWPLVIGAGIAAAILFGLLIGILIKSL